MKNIRTLILIVLFGVFALPGYSVSRAGLGDAPPRAVLVANHLRNVSLNAVSPGVVGARTLASNGVEMIVFKIDPKIMQFDLAQQNLQDGERAEAFGARSQAMLVFNGGFFSVDAKGVKRPVGLLVRNGRHFSTAWKKSGGYLVIRNDRVTIGPTGKQIIRDGDSVLQSKPMLIEPGGVWAMNTNRAIPRKRTVMCSQKDGTIVVLAIVGGGLSLYETGWLMRDESVGGVFGCDSALAMDGGGSTQIWVKDHPELSFEGETSIHNAVIIRQR